MGETIVIKNRQKRGIYQSLVNELVLADRGDYRRFMRMNTETLDCIPMVSLMCLKKDFPPKPFLKKRPYRSVKKNFRSRTRTTHIAVT